MTNTAIYQDIAKRTDGDIYIGVVGPVRTGKSTFIKRFMDGVVLPGIDNVYMRERAKDELPQSGSGRTIMTAEPKFVPEEAVEIKIDDTATARVRLIDSVGYMVDSALGQTENDQPRMVMTPWSEGELPMAEAAEIGTRKVIAEHSTIGLVITTDGTVTEIPRADYEAPEGRVINELKELGKPFIVLVNSASPESAAAQELCRELGEKYDVSCRAVNCLTLDEYGINDILRSVLMEFPVRELGIRLPAWAKGLPADHPVKAALFGAVLDMAGNVASLRGVYPLTESLKSSPYVSAAAVESIDLGSGTAIAVFDMPRELYYEVIAQESGVTVHDESEIIPLLRELSAAKREYDRLVPALEQVRSVGYGIVMPEQSELSLEEPVIVRQGSRFGVKLRASAPSIHLIRADIKTEVSPAVGSEQQSEELLQYILKEFEGDAGRIWQSNIFGKSLHDLVNEGLTAKLNHMPDTARLKLQETLQRIINEGSGGLICIIL